MADIDDMPGWTDLGVGSDQEQGAPLNEAAAVGHIMRLMDDESQWDTDDLLAEHNFMKLLSFMTREGVIVQLYLVNSEAIVLAKNNTLGDNLFRFLALPGWAIRNPRWAVRGLVEFGLGTWGV